MTSTLAGMPLTTSPVKPACDACGAVHVGTDIFGKHRFNPDVPTLYAARYEGAPYRETREEADADMCLKRQQRARAARPAVSLLQWEDLTDGERTVILTAASVLGSANHG